MQKLHLVGIGGNGMSALAQIYAMRGYSVTGSDKFLDSGITNLAIWNSLKKLGVKFYPQDGSAITENLDAVVLSGAISTDNPDFVAAKKMGIKLVHRSKVLSDIISGYSVLAVTGTSGKSTTTAMIFEILSDAGLDPSIITGGPLLSLMEKGLVGNVFLGKSNIMVIEADESDGSFVNYHPETAIMLNLTKDHKSLDTLQKYFGAFRKNCEKFIVNADEENLQCFATDKTFGLKKGATRAENIKLNSFNSEFEINGIRFKINIGGRHNVSNAAAAISVCTEMGVDLKSCVKALGNFKGVHRRFNSVGKANDIEVIDDFAHNPEKIKASIRAAQLRGRRVIAFYQPHGYAPMKIYGSELADAFLDVLRMQDILWLCDVYRMGGSPIKEVCVESICKFLKEKGSNAFYASDKEKIITQITATARPGDTVLIMGARDPLLNDYSHRVFDEIKRKSKVSASV